MAGGALTPILAARVVVPFALGYFLSYLFRVVNAVIAPDLTADLALSPASLGLLTSAYFLTFAAFQLPLGILLDRYGPRRVEAALLLIAAVGALTFALAPSTPLLIFGRALVGLGVSACLMAAFTAYVMWFPSERLALVNGIHLTAGGLGALAGTTPVEAALHITDWRGVFFGLAVLTLITAAALILIVPEREAPHHGATFKQSWKGLVSVFHSTTFWCVAPLTVLSQAAFLAVQTLWAGPWLADVAGMDRDSVAAVLFLTAAGMTAGFLLTGIIAERLARMGVRTITSAIVGMGLFALVQVGLILEWTSLAVPLWIAYGFLGTTGVLSYAALSQTFPKQLAGRVNTSLNLLVFALAFAAQWATGWVIGLWPQDALGHNDPQGYQVAFAILFILQVLALIVGLARRGGSNDAQP